MRRLQTVALLAALALSSAAPAAAQQSGARAEAIAMALREDPVFVSDSLARVATPEAVARVRAAAARWRQPLWVVWAPEFTEEPGVDRAGDLLTQVRDRLGEPGVYVWMSEDGLSSDVQTSGPVRVAGNPDRAGIVSSRDVELWRGAGPRLVYQLDYVRTGERPTRGVGQAYLDQDERATARGWVVLGVVVAVTWLALTLVWVVRRRRRTPRASGSAPPRTVEKDAAAALSALRERLAGAPAPPEPAVDAEAAGRAVLDRGGEPVDAVGALVLARLGDSVLDGEVDRRPCFVNPLHGWAARTTRFARDGQTLPIPACEHCATSLERGVPVLPLLDDGRPYWERDTIWARTGFGALDGGLATDLLAGRR